MATPNIEQLTKHRNNLASCKTFEEFKAVQIDFVNLLIKIITKKEEDLKEAARQVLGL